MAGNIISRYFDWLQKDNPAGTLEIYPELSSESESSVKGVYIAGDLTGIPLLRLAAEGGHELVEKIAAQLDGRQAAEGVYDLIIIGGGPAGISAAISAQKLGLNYALFEANQLFNTIENFPTAKPIIATPEMHQRAHLKIGDGSKESLLQSLHAQLAECDLVIKMQTDVSSLQKRGDLIEVETTAGNVTAQRVILAIGKSGKARQLGVPGQELDKVYDSLHDASVFRDAEILVVGGGDSALEASIALAQTGNRVSHSYRKESFSRPKQKNAAAFQALVEEGKITPLFNSQLQRIEAEKVQLATPAGERELPNDYVFSLIGRQLPLDFFRRSGIKLQGERGASWWIYLVAMLSFFTMLYFGKSGLGVELFAAVDGPGAWLQAYLVKPLSLGLSWSLEGSAWYASLNFYLGWVGSLVWLLSAPAALICMLRRREYYFGAPWGRIKYSYLIAVSCIYTWVYFSQLLMRSGGWLEDPTYWYSLLYCTTMLLFGLRRALVKPTHYIRLQMSALIFIQIFFLFLLPFYLYDALIVPLCDPDGFVMREIFPLGKWQSFGFILFWPLSISYFGSSTFWTWFPFLQSGLFLFLLIKFFGKGGYCGWICSCGGMAESLGDEYREKAPHGPVAKRWENLGQVILALIIVATLLRYLDARGITDLKLGSELLWDLYRLAIDAFFAGVLGLGIYFFMGGRIWCRYGCPLAALMHIYARFTDFRIFADKSKCISCNGCTKVCHMGIDVMNFANKGRPMDDVQCVRCSSCVDVCPTDVLSFGRVRR